MFQTRRLLYVLVHLNAVLCKGAQIKLYIKIYISIAGPVLVHHLNAVLCETTLRLNCI